MSRKVILGIILFLSPFVLTGCVGELQAVLCDFFPDGDHCYQSAAVQSGDIEECEKISGEKFKDVGSNPPRDKCYLQIAENTGNLEACKKIKGGPMSYTMDECVLSVSLSYENPAGCKLLSGSAKSQCLRELGAKMTPEKVLEVDSAINDLKETLKNGSDQDLEKQLKGLEDKRKEMLGIMSKENQAEYAKLSDPINQEIIGDFATGDIDSGLKNKLITFNEKLKTQGFKMTMEHYEAVRDYYQYISDPKNDIEKMDDEAIAKDRWNEKVGNVVNKLKFWKTNPTEAEKDYDEQLRFYERMLERQAAIAEGLTELQEDFERNMGMVLNAGGDKVVDIAKDKIIESIFGELTGKTVGWTTAVVGEALDTVKAEAKSMEFRGLVRAYNMGMEEELGKFGGDVDKAHAEVVKKLYGNPYEYEDQNNFAKYGNILENKDCDGSNPHCINRDVFWKAMKKSYNYQHK